MKPKIIIMAGIPASGKSSIVNQRYNDWFIIDCDKIQYEFVQNEYISQNQGHIIAKSIESELLIKTINSKQDFVYDTTASVFAPMEYFVNELKEVGYYIKLVYVKCPISVAIKRNNNRQRKIDDSIIYRKAEEINSTIEKLKNIVDEYEEIDNE